MASTPLSKRPHHDLDASTDSTNSVNDESKVMLALSDLKGQLNEMKATFDSLLLEVRDNSKYMRDVSNRLDDVQQTATKNEAVLAEIKADVASKDEAIRKIIKRVDNAYVNMERMNSELTKTQQRCSSLEKQLHEVNQQSIDQEARSRRNNLLFYGVAETEEDDAREELSKFLIDKCGLPHAKDMLIQRVHRLPTRKIHGKTRPIIASFVDFRQREMVRSSRRNLKGPHAISEDFPRQIREARKMLSGEFGELAKNRQNKLGVAYPAKLICNGKVIRVVDPVTLKNVQVK